MLLAMEMKKAEDGEMDEMGDENEEEDLEDNEVDDVRGSRRTELKEDWGGSSEAHNEQASGARRCLL
jgi:hypothetical protein